MGELPLISVVTISRNSVATIERTIRSVLDQAYPDLEYIVIDGGSTDGTADVVARHGGALAHWVSEPDRGISHAFNKGIAAARGELVGIINADDWYEPGAIAAVAEAYGRSGGADVLYGDLALREWGRVQRGEARFADRILYTMPTLNHPTCFVRAAAYRRYGVYRERFSVAMDYDLLRRFYSLGATFLHVDAVVANMSMGGASQRLLVRRYAEVLEIAGYHPKAFGYVARHQLLRWTDQVRRALSGGRGDRSPGR